MSAHYTIGFNFEERKELLEIFKDNPKWKKRIEEGFGFQVSDNIKNFNYNFSLPGPIEGIDYKMIDNGDQPSGIEWVR